MGVLANHMLACCNITNGDKAEIIVIFDAVIVIATEQQEMSLGWFWGWVVSEAVTAKKKILETVHRAQRTVKVFLSHCFLTYNQNIFIQNYFDLKKKELIRDIFPQVYRTSESLTVPCLLATQTSLWTSYFQILLPPLIQRDFSLSWSYIMSRLFLTSLPGWVTERQSQWKRWLSTTRARMTPAQLRVKTARWSSDRYQGTQFRITVTSQLPCFILFALLFFSFIHVVFTISWLFLFFCFIPTKRNCLHSNELMVKE